MKKQELTRRQLLAYAALGAASVTISPILGRKRLMAAPAGGGGTPGKFIVVINMIGGNDGVNMVVPSGYPTYRTRRPTINLVDNLPVGETLWALDATHSLHYRLAGLKQLWDDGDMHIVNKVSYPSPNQSHFTSRDIYSFGVRNYVADGDGRGWLGRFADSYWSGPSDPLGVISVGLAKQPDFRSDVTDPLVLTTIPGFSIDTDSDFGNDHTLRELAARNILMTDAVPPADPRKKIFEVSRETYPLVDQVQADTATWVNPGTYPTSAIGNNMRTISQLLHPHATWGTQVFYTGFGGFDTHSGQHSGGGGQNFHAALMQNLDQAVTAFANDMKAKGKWNDTVIVVISEFGRRTYENGSNGTDHGHGSACFVIGGAVKGNMVGTGMTAPLVDSDLMVDYVPYAVDFRNMYGNIVQNHLGLDAVPLFPDPAFVPSFASVDLI